MRVEVHQRTRRKCSTNGGGGGFNNSVSGDASRTPPSGDRTTLLSPPSSASLPSTQLISLRGWSNISPGGTFYITPSPQTGDIQSLNDLSGEVFMLGHALFCSNLPCVTSALAATPQDVGSSILDLWSAGVARRGRASRTQRRNVEPHAKQWGFIFQSPLWVWRGHGSKLIEEILKFLTVTRVVNWPAFGKGALQNSTRERHMSLWHPRQ